MKMRNFLGEVLDKSWVSEQRYRTITYKMWSIVSKLFQTCTGYLRQKLNPFPELVLGKSSKIAWKFRIAMKWDASSWEEEIEVWNVVCVGLDFSSSSLEALLQKK